MLTVSQLSAKLAAMLQPTDADEFVVWFRSESRDFHIWADEPLKDLIWTIESILSEYEFGEMDASTMKQHLMDAIDPFVECVAEQNTCGDPYLLPTAISAGANRSNHATAGA